jgi:hypothetical protein
LIAATSGKSTKLIFYVFCISNFTHYAVTDYVHHTRIENRTENYSSRNHRKKPNSIILCQPRPPQSSVHNTSQATLQTQIPSQTKLQSRSRNQKISYKNTSIRSRLDKQYTIHSTQPIYINPNAANNIPHRKKKSQNHSNYVLATLCTPETCQKIGKTKLQQPTQPIHVSQIVRTQHPSTTKKPDASSRPRTREGFTQSPKNIPHSNHKILINKNNNCNMCRGKETAHPKPEQRCKQHQRNGWQLKLQVLDVKPLTPCFQPYISKILQTCILTIRTYPKK